MLGAGLLLMIPGLVFSEGRIINLMGAILLFWMSFYQYKRSTINLQKRTKAFYKNLLTNSFCILSFLLFILVPAPLILQHLLNSSLSSPPLRLSSLFLFATLLLFYSLNEMILSVNFARLYILFAHIKTKQETHWAQITHNSVN